MENKIDYKLLKLIAIYGEECYRRGVQQGIEFQKIWPEFATKKAHHLRFDAPRQFRFEFNDLGWAKFSIWQTLQSEPTGQILLQYLHLNRSTLPDPTKIKVPLPYGKDRDYRKLKRLPPPQKSEKGVKNA